MREREGIGQNLRRKRLYKSEIVWYNNMKISGKWEVFMDLWSWICLGVFLASAASALVLRHSVLLGILPGALLSVILSLLLPIGAWSLLVLVLGGAGGALVLLRLRGRPMSSLEAMVGRSCTVTERLDSETGGQVSVDGGLWAARALAPGTAYEPGDVLTVVAIEGVKLICQ